jgi:hypothetical protein
VLVLAGHDGDEQVLIDPMTLDPGGRTTLDQWQPSPGGDLLSFQLSRGGDEHEPRCRVGGGHAGLPRRPHRADAVTSVGSVVRHGRAWRSLIGLAVLALIDPWLAVAFVAGIVLVVVVLWVFVRPGSAWTTRRRRAGSPLN